MTLQVRRRSERRRMPWRNGGGITFEVAREPDDGDFDWRYSNTPSELNSVTITHYRVVYHRTDGRNVEGVDVPFAFDSGMTITVSATGQGQQTFDLVRISAKFEAPLRALASNNQGIDTIADVTFYGKDMHNNDVAVTGSIGIAFANFAG